MGAETVDDMETSLRSPSYARSSDMFSHVGTVPRSDKLRKSQRGLKEKKKKENVEEGMSGGQSKGKVEDCVRASPLLSALSSLSISSMEQPQPASGVARPLPTTPMLNRASPLTSAPDSCSNDPLADPITGHDVLTCREPSNAPANARKASNQDVYVPMDPITDPQAERPPGVTQETSKTFNSSQEMKSDDK